MNCNIDTGNDREELKTIKMMFTKFTNNYTNMELPFVGVKYSLLKYEHNFFQKFM